MSRWLTQFRLALRSVFRRERVDQELDEELQYHLERQIEEGVNAGLTPQEARYTALREMGAIAKNKEECRDMRRVNFVDDLWRDLRYARRSMRRSPGFTALAVLIMALGIGANTAVFSVVNTVLLRPLSYRDPDRIVTFAYSSTTGAAASSTAKIVSIPNFQDWHDRSSSFEAMAYYASRETAVMAGSAAEYAQATVVGPEFFRVFAVEPIIGRLFTAEEMQPGGGGALVISHAYWRSHFGGDPGVLGKTVRMSGRTLHIAGVLPPDFRFPGKTDLWFPNTRPTATEARFSRNYLAVGRLKPGVSLERAQTELTSIALRLEQQYPESNKGQGVAVARMRDDMVGDVRLTLYLLLGAVSVVLLIACANTATLLLGKATARTREVAVRIALGASHRRIVRQLITESFLLAFLAGTAGLVLAYGGSKALVALAPANLPRFAETGIDRWVLAFTFGISLTTSLLFGLVPALYASKVDLNDALKQGGRSVMGGGLIRIRGVLVVAEIALAVVLLSGAGLLIKSFVALNQVALGFRPENVLVMRATVPRLNTPDEAQRANRFFKDVLSKTASLPGVLAAGATMAPPGHVFGPGGQESRGVYFLDHMPANPDFSAPGAPIAAINIVAPGTFAALGIPLKGGRDFNDNDSYDRPFVAVINEALVRKSFYGENPIGKTIFCLFDSPKGSTIVGIVGDVRQYGPDREPMPECYMSYLQHQYNGTTLSIVARTVGKPSPLAETVQRLARERSPDVPMKFTTMEATLSENVATPRFRSLLFALFAGLAVCLAMAGVYGVMAYAVSQRSNEIGLRIALGASTGSVLRLILRQGLTLVSVGIALGLAAAAAGTRLLTTMLFQVKANDPLVYLAVAVLLSLVALFASYVPARRASKIDPLAAIRQE
jgi:putative ABC transport system permease protein